MPTRMRYVVLMAGSALVACRGDADPPERKATLLDADAPVAEVLIADENPEEAVADVLRLLDTLADTTIAEGRAEFEVSAVARQLGGDPMAILAWVRDSTRLLPYEGALRGAVGVLSDRSGGALDRALLLEALLRESGYETRIAMGATDVPIPSEVLSNRSNPQVNPESSIERFSHLYSPLIGGSDVRDSFRAARHRGQELERRARSRSREQVNEIRTTLTARGFAAADGKPGARRNWWVQAKLDGEWQDLAPDATQLSPDAPIAVERIFEVDELLDSGEPWLHRVALRVVVETRAAEGLREDTVLSHELSTASLPTAIVPVRLSYLPDGDESHVDPEGSLSEITAQIAEWRPVLTVGREQILGTAFSVYEAASTDASSQPGRGGGLSAPFGNDAVVGSSTPEAVRNDRVTAMWLEIEIFEMGTRVEHARRAIFDLRGPTARWTTEAPPSQLRDEDRRKRGVAFLGDTDLLIFGADATPEAAEWFLAGSLTAAVGSYAALTDTGDLDSLLERFSELRPVSMAPLGLAVARTAWRDTSLHSFVDRINVFAYHRSVELTPDDDIVVSSAFDIIASHVGVNNSSAADAFEARLSQGVLDANAEALLARSSDQTGAVADLHGPARREGIAWIALLSQEDPERVRLSLPPEVLTRIASDLADGFVVVAPERAVPLGGEPTVGWWKIEPSTGYAIGIGERGWGQAVTQRTILNRIPEIAASPTFKLIRAVVELNWCVAKLVGSLIRERHQTDGPLPKDVGVAAANEGLICLLRLNCVFFDVGGVPLGFAICEAAQRIHKAMQVMQRLPGAID